LFDSEAALVRVRRELGWLKDNAEAADLVFFYFAGHGYQGDDDNGDELDGVDEFMVLADTQADAKEDTALRDDEFGRFLDEVRSEHVMVVFDSCYSGGQGRSVSGGTRPLADKFDLFNDFALEGKLILAAAKEDQKSSEDPSLGHGVFTYFLLEGLRGAADQDGNHRVTAGELYVYTQSRVQAFARGTLNRSQEPQLTGRGTTGVIVTQLNEPPQAAFLVEPQVPSTSVKTRFLDDSKDDVAVTGWTWSFDDGTESVERSPAHLYTRAGTYLVALTVVDGEGARASSEKQVVVIPPGEVTNVYGEGQVVISLGSQHGVAVGDRFEVVRILERTSGPPLVEKRGLIEVVEVHARDRSSAQILAQEFPIELHDVLQASETQRGEG
jgi:hypothetical protein